MLYMARHGESEANVRGVYAGQKDDSPLTTKGEEQAKEVGRNILKEGIFLNRIKTSPLKRAKQTAYTIANVLGLSEDKIEIDVRLAEYDMGNLTGTPAHDIPSREFVATQGAEDTQLFKDRVMNCIDEARMLDGNTLLVAHGGVLRIIESSKRNLDPKDFMDIPLPKNASLTQI